MFLTSKTSLQSYNSKTHYPTSRRDMLNDQVTDPVYGVFAQQTGYAESVPVYDWDTYAKIFSQAMDSVLATSSADDAMRTVGGAIDALLPAAGMVPSITLKPGPTPSKTQQSK
jgi:hypothetical protein